MTIAALAMTVALLGGTDAALLRRGDVAMESAGGADWRFTGELGRRVERNVDRWLLRAPDTNPGLIEMFRRRDRRLPYAEPVPWAGEFAGKYLISAVQACTMTDDARLRPSVQAFVDELVSTQADDGYLGPWPEDERLLGHWDLWGHYHCMLGLLMWHDLSGGPGAFDAAVRAADCIANIYLEDRWPIEAGTPPMNLSVLHVLGELYRRTGDERYRGVIARIEEDLQQDGDWLREGAAGTPYYKLPGSGTRWESLHIVQGLAQLYWITGEGRYKKAVVQLWDSIREYDRHPSGAFSTHESAYGTIYESGSIETCCSVAWEALTIDVLRLTGDPAVADELELTTWNQVLGAQHPSGSWWTYDTPMDGVRAPSFHQINFQYRPGTPELNCCSVNAPRGLGMLSEWAVMRDADGLVVNFYGPSSFTIPGDGNRPGVTLTQAATYPVNGDVRLRIDPEQAASFTLKLRIPAWSAETKATVAGQPIEDVEAGAYLALERTWEKGDEVRITFDMTPRTWAGKGSRHGHVAVHRGPLLLSYDARYGPIETPELPRLDAEMLTSGDALRPVAATVDRAPGSFPPMGLWRAEAADGTEVVLCDFASAGAHGTDYVSWLPAANVPPPAARLEVPESGAKGKPGPVLFRWASGGPAEGCTFELVVARDQQFTDIAAHEEGLQGTHCVVDGLEEGDYHWHVKTVGPDRTSVSEDSPHVFEVTAEADALFFTMDEADRLLVAGLAGGSQPLIGRLVHEQNLAATAGPGGQPDTALAFNGHDSELTYAVPFVPERDYSFSGWICPEDAGGGFQEAFSMWCMGMDDPLRVCVDDGQLFARIEAGRGYGTPGLPITNGQWLHVAAVKEGAKLTLYVNGDAVRTCDAPAHVRSKSSKAGIGFNPLYSGGEHFKGRIADIAFYARALTPAEVAQLAE